VAATPFPPSVPPGDAAPGGVPGDGAPADGIVIGSDGRPGCWWAGGDSDYRRYHDEEWGRPVTSDVRLFEKLCLEGFQAGLSWLTILRKRENFRRAFAGFDPEVVARFGPDDEARLMADAGIVRNRAKIAATVNNAARMIELQQTEGSLAAYVWRFEPTDADRPPRLDHATLAGLGSTAASKALSKDLKRRGWRFVGPTTVYAFMQAMGLVNDHLEGCWVREEVEAARLLLRRPGSATDAALTTGQAADTAH
jgi:DNA-3-methyladenine glycosylase I